MLTTKGQDEDRVGREKEWPIGVSWGQRNVTKDKEARQLFEDTQEAQLWLLAGICSDTALLVAPHGDL